MKFDSNDIFAVEIEGAHYHLEHIPSHHKLSCDDLIMRDDKEWDDDTLFFCEKCGRQIE